MKYLNAPGSYPPTTANDCQLIGILDTATRNLGRVLQKGVDLGLNYRTDLSIGALSVDANFTKILDLKRNVLPGTPLTSALDVIGEQNSERGRAQVGLKHGQISGNVAVNYTGPYLNNQTPTVGGVKVPDQNVGAWTTFDLNLSFTPDIKGGIFGDTVISLSVRNFTDKDAPVVLQTATAVDLANANVFGRITTLEVSKKF